MEHKYLDVIDTEIGEGELLALASTWEVDLVKDRVVRGAYADAVARIKAGEHLPLIWGHDASGSPQNFVGEIVDADETDQGLEIHGRFDLDDDAGRKAYRLVKRGSIKALSIGYRVLEKRRAPGGITELLKIDLAEVSLVLDPANPGARILAIKRDDGTPTVEQLRDRERALGLDHAPVKAEWRDAMLNAMGHTDGDAVATDPKSLRQKAAQVEREHAPLTTASFDC